MASYSLFPQQKPPRIGEVKPRMARDSVQRGLPRSAEMVQNYIRKRVDPDNLLSFGERMGQILAGPYDHALTPQQNSDARRRSMSTFGAMMLATGGKGKDFFGSLGESLLAAQQTGQQSREYSYEMDEMLDKRADKDRLEMSRTKLQDYVKKMGSNIDVPQLRKMFVQTVADGDVEGGRNIAMVLQVLEGQQNATTRKDPVNWTAFQSGRKWYERNPETGVTRKLLLEDGTHADVDPSSGLLNMPGLAAERDFSREQRLADAFERNMKNFDIIAQSYGTVQAAVVNPDAVGDMALIFAYMKLLDPGSTVREGEYANAQNAGSIPQRVWAQYNQAVDGTKFKDEVRNSFVERARLIANAKRVESKAIINRYTKRAQEARVNPGMVVYDPFESYPETFQRTKPKAGGAPNYEDFVGGMTKKR